MNETNHESNQHIAEEEPQLFEEKKDKKILTKTKLTLLGIVAIGVFVLLPKSGVEGEAVLQAEKFARMGLTSSGVLKDLYHEKGEALREGALIARFENRELLKLYKQAEIELQTLSEKKAIFVEKLKFLGKERKRKQILHENSVIGIAFLEKARLDYDEAYKKQIILEKEIQSATEELDYLKSRVESLELKAPFDGVLLTDPSDTIGSPIKEGEFVLEMADPETYFLETLVPEKEVQKISVGSKVKAKFHAFSWKAYSGEVVRIAPRTTQEVEKVFKIRHVIPCEIKLHNIPNNIKYGMRASVRIKPGKKKLFT